MVAVAGYRAAPHPTAEEIERGYRSLRGRMLLSVAWLLLAAGYLSLTRGDALMWCAVWVGYCLWAVVALALVRRALGRRCESLALPRR
jgi:hypothetical protein